MMQREIPKLQTSANEPHRYSVDLLTHRRRRRPRTPRQFEAQVRAIVGWADRKRQIGTDPPGGSQLSSACDSKTGLPLKRRVSFR